MFEIQISHKRRFWTFHAHFEGSREVEVAAQVTGQHCPLETGRGTAAWQQPESKESTGLRDSWRCFIFIQEASSLYLFKLFGCCYEPSGSPEVRTKEESSWKLQILRVVTQCRVPFIEQSIHPSYLLCYFVTPTQQIRVCNWSSWKETNAETGRTCKLHTERTKDKIRQLFAIRGSTIQYKHIGILVRVCPCQLYPRYKEL